MTDTNEVVFDFSKTQEQLAEKRAKKEQRKQQNIDASYLKNRGTILAKAREKTASQRPVARLRNAWAKAWEELPDEQKNVIDAAHSEAVLMWREINDAMKNMSAGIAHIEAPFIELTFESGKEFMAKQANGGSWPDIEFLASLSAEDFESVTACDLPLRNYGRLTTLPCVIWANFLAASLAYVNSRPEEFEQSFREELESLVNHFPPPPVPAQIIGLKMATRSEEQAREQQREIVAVQQKLGVLGYERTT